jgi:DNA-binding response OmpR family regulator
MKRGVGSSEAHAAPLLLFLICDRINTGGDIMTDILIVEDDKELAGLLTDFLRDEGYTVTAVESGERALELFEKYGARLVVLDINLPDVNGFAVCSKLRENADTPILIVSARTDKEDKLNGLDLGADDYIEKPYDIDILIAKIKGIFKRRYQQEILSADGVTLNLADRTATIDGKAAELPAKEFDLLVLFLENQGKALKKEYLFSTVWGSDSDSELQTLHVHINRLRQKLGDAPKNAKRLLTVWGVGYKFI